MYVGLKHIQYQFKHTNIFIYVHVCIYKCTFIYKQIQTDKLRYKDTKLLYLCVYIHTYLPVYVVCTYVCSTIVNNIK